MKRGNIPVTSGFISLLVFASMSYPFNILPFLIILVLLITLILSENTISNYNNFIEKGILLNWKISFLILLVSCIFTLIQFNRQRLTCEAYKTWNNLKMLDVGNPSNSLIQDYEKLFPYLSDQTQFLFEYAQNLSKRNEYEKSNSLLIQASCLSCDPMIFNIIGKNYQKMGNFVKAEQYYLHSSHLVPNRIYPYFLLTHLYYERKDSIRFINMAKKVLEKKPKIHSTAIDEMKIKVNKMIKEQYKIDTINFKNDIQIYN